MEELENDEAAYKHDVALQLLEECALDPFRQRVMLATLDFSFGARGGAGT